MVCLAVKQSVQKPTGALETAKKLIRREIKKITESESILSLDEPLGVSSPDKPKRSTLIFERGTKNIARRARNFDDTDNNSDKITMIIESVNERESFPCKVIQVNDKKISGYQLSKCAPKKEQLNNFKDLHCETVYRNIYVELNNSDGNVKFRHKVISVGCEV